jgi:hypothetical protein
VSEGESKGALAEYLETRVRAVKVVDVSGFFGIGGKEIAQIAFRPLTAEEQHRALRDAHSYVRELSGENSTLAADPDLLEGVKLAAIACAMCRRVEEVNGKPRYVNPAFTHLRWMFQHIEPERIDVLVRIGNSVRDELGPHPIRISPEELDAVRLAAVVSADTDQRFAVFSGMPRSYLEHVITMLSIRVEELEDKVRCESVGSIAASLPESLPGM